MLYNVPHGAPQNVTREIDCSVLKCSTSLIIHTLVHGRHCKMSLPACPHLQELKTIFPYFISPLYSCDTYRCNRVWLVFTTSPANFDTWFHWRRWDLKGGGHGSPSPSSPRCLMYCTWAAGCKKCVSSPLLFSLMTSLSFFEVKKTTFQVSLLLEIYSYLQNCTKIYTK